MKLAYTRLVPEKVSVLSAFYARLTGAEPRGNDDYVELHPGGAVLAICSRSAA